MPRNTKKVYKIYHTILQKKKHLSAKRSTQLQFLVCACCVWAVALPVGGWTLHCHAKDQVLAPSNLGSQVVSGLPWWILHTFPFWCFLSWMGIYRLKFCYLLVSANALQIFPLWKGCFPPSPHPLGLCPSRGVFQSKPNWVLPKLKAVYWKKNELKSELFQLDSATLTVVLWQIPRRQGKGGASPVGAFLQPLPGLRMNGNGDFILYKRQDLLPLSTWRNLWGEGRVPRAGACREPGQRFPALSNPFQQSPEMRSHCSKTCLG